MTNLRPGILAHVAKKQPEYAAALKLARVWKKPPPSKKGPQGGPELRWEAPSIISHFDLTIQKLVADHTEVRLKGPGQSGKSDYYLHSFLEFDVNQDVKCVKQLLRARA